MAACALCDRQQGKPVKIDPHPRLRIESTRIAGESDTYAYACRDCAAKWLRVIVKRDARETMFWRTVPRLPEPV